MKKIKDYYNKTKFPFIMVLISFIFLLLSIYLSFEMVLVNDKIFSICMGLLLFIIFLLITRLTNRFYEKKNTKVISNIVTVFVTLIFAIYCMNSVFSLAIVNSIMNPEIKNVKHYKKYIKGDRLLQAFPSEIPDGVEDVRLIYSPGFLQAGNIYILYYIDDNLDVIEFDNKYEMKSEWIGYNDDDDNPIGEISFYNLPIDEKDTNNFKIYVIESSCDETGWCNHGDYLIVAINEYTKQVVYKSMVW